MNFPDHNPAPPTTATRGNVIVGPDVGEDGGKKGKGRRPRIGGGKRQETAVRVDADLFGNELIYQLVDDLLVPAIVEQIVQDVLTGKERPESK